MDLGLLPHTAKGPLKTPAIENYDSPDGEYTNTTRKYDGEEWEFDAVWRTNYTLCQQICT